ncbi:hypothetical protein SERLA73DRAFT_184586 [Serpula lacrymans var. lacrymans S7.3]|uniref:DJ-1/PfpI domain-containing protein n=2 Tax=Serpula lacrymans var. lacrymans TaxID=341189 RepID=F8Q4N9_SERL3|nr:uncharacterized protein SERLADRAFT_472350 [Serpula lacrymans var. lacrymans S7.9]EGN96516.1 hypothetical protein SERLA73DRAFT_184586 [Serpula lacrymans var. lacrymans S7.3]EGO22061.1 hypothetical protein SERLADRAFT_472350 [Serpula lacrymans var. lacrymans S7.9]
MTDYTTLSLVVCLYEDVTALDFQGPLQLIGMLQEKNIQNTSLPFPSPPTHAVKITYAGDSTAVTPDAGPTFAVEKKNTYEELLGSGEQFDMILVPGASPKVSFSENDPIARFIRQQSSGAKYILSVCTGAWRLAEAGVLKGKRATSNKATWPGNPVDPSIEWVKKARWVVNGQNSGQELWTSSGVTAGMDMANAFLAHLVGRPISERIRNVVELNASGPEDDPFAEYWGI